MAPLMGLAVFFWEKGSAPLAPHNSIGVGSLVLLAAITVAGFAAMYSTALSQDSKLFLRILSLVTLWIGGFILCYGTQAFRARGFPLRFSLLMVPLPHFLMDKPIEVIRHGSAEVASLFFRLAGVPVFRDGMRFSLPGLDMEVATQCSGIHSSLALFVLSLLVGHFYLKSGWKKVALSLSVLPIISLTNGFRIFTISWLSAYVDMSFIKGDLHRKGGVLFFLLGLMLLASLVRWLRIRERGKRNGAEPVGDMNGPSAMPASQTPPAG
ncbi:MAG: exosortase/archaeosortase family protein [Terriglobia bacterium]